MQSTLGGGCHTFASARRRAFERPMLSVHEARHRSYLQALRPCSHVHACAQHGAANAEPTVGLRTKQRNAALMTCAGAGSHG